MSAESSSVIKRQWHIVRFLLAGTYVATSDIKAHLHTIGIEAELRTIQRDLRMLEDIFPLECREDCIPHSWRWKRLPNTPIRGLNPTQALTLCMVEQQLQDVIPAHLLNELQPLFEKAKVVTGMLSMDALSKATEAPRHPPKDPRQFGITGGNPSPFDHLFAEATAMLTGLFHNPEKEKTKKAQQALKEVISLLEQVELTELSKDLKKLV
mgnify:FL=1